MARGVVIKQYRSKHVHQGFVFRGGIAIITRSALGNQGYVAELKLAPDNEIKQSGGRGEIGSLLVRGSGAQGGEPSVFGEARGLYV